MIEIKQREANTYTFIVKAESGSILLNGVKFIDKNKVENTVKNLSLIGSRRNTFERKTNHAGEFLFSVKNIQGEIIGNSQLYKSEAGMENGIKNLKIRISSLSTLNQI